MKFTTCSTRRTVATAVTLTGLALAPHIRNVASDADTCS